MFFFLLKKVFLGGFEYVHFVLFEKIYLIRRIRGPLLKHLGLIFI